MKKIIITLICITCFSITNQTQSTQKKLNINIQKSTIKWIGEYTFYFGGHDGFVNFKDGYFIKSNDAISGGEFIIDMNSITNTDIKKLEGKTNLVNHLKDPDFFNVEKHPLAKLIITKVEYFDKTHAKIEADLTLKGITKPINFRAELNYEERKMTTRFKIDRRAWGVNYKSNFRDGAISDAIGFEVIVKL
ncbi:polyisoprenoid-binding protein YceI [Tenacibaculum gallaicum]|uniref:Polyisoprenoid-binding protein YceI n=1 Tax=Tenacibaculum gallaicum TaxID=561505 RepID=A0A3E0I7I0_9FLAO|nr:YceI family protein [Tenacibaculum gallaicum]REH54714.1 polyisoprenoid-binding protein YceI [Tenacibaculum gallaicum]